MTDTNVCESHEKIIIKLTRLTTTFALIGFLLTLVGGVILERMFVIVDRMETANIKTMEAINQSSKQIGINTHRLDTIEEWIRAVDDMRMHSKYNDQRR